MLAGAFNFQGRVRKTFYVLTDDKIGSGPRLKPGVLAQKPVAESGDGAPMETDADSVEDESPPPAVTPMTLAAKLAAQSNKRKATETLASDTSVKSKRK